MSSPYGPPGGQQGPGSYGGPRGAPWGPGQGGPGYGGAPQGGQGLWAGSDARAPGAGYPPAYGGPDQRGQGQAGSDAGPPRSGSRSKPRQRSTSPAFCRWSSGYSGCWPSSSGSCRRGNSISRERCKHLGLRDRRGLPADSVAADRVLAVAPLVPKGRKYTLPTALLAIVGFLAALTQLISG